MNKITSKAFNYTLCIVNCALVLACSSDDELSSAYLSDPNAVIVNATIGSPSQTRLDTDDKGSTWDSKDQIYVTNTSSNALSGRDAAVYEATVSEGKTTWTVSSSYYMVWVDGDKDGKNSFEAYYPYSERTTTTSFKGFTLPADQSTKDGLKSADWMLATAESAKPSTKTISLPFAHQLAKVTIVINNTYGEQYKGQTLEFSEPKITVPTSKTTIENKTITFDGNTVTAYKGTNESGGNTTFTAILMPGSYTASGEFFSLKVKNSADTSTEGETLKVLVPANSTLTTGLKSGKSYTLNLTVGKSVMTIGSVSVESWDGGTLNEKTGTADVPTT